MDTRSLVTAWATRVAALGGFLEGITYLNEDHRSDFATAFVVDATDEAHFLTHIRSCFSHLPGLAIRLDESFQGGFRQLEQDISSLLLASSIVEDSQRAQDMRSYLSFKIMDRLDDIINDCEHLDDSSALQKYSEPTRFIGTHDNAPGAMIFYLLRAGDVCFTLYFLSSKPVP